MKRRSKQEMAEYQRNRRKQLKSASQGAPQSTNSVTPECNTSPEQLVTPQNVTPPGMVWVMGTMTNGKHGMVLIKRDTPICEAKSARLTESVNKATAIVRTLSPHRDMSIPACVADGVVPFCRVVQR